MVAVDAPPSLSLALRPDSDGLAVGSAQFIEQNVIRWSDVTDIRSIWNNRFDPVSEESEPRLSAYQLSLYDGRTVVIPSTMQNMLDPDAPVGRMISALIPTSVAQTIPRFPVIDEIIQQHVTHHDQR